MTTIATDGKTMAGDGQREHRGTICVTGAQKVRCLRDGSVVGTAGDVALGYALVEWLERGGEAPELKPEAGFSALHLRPGGEVVMYDQHCRPLPVLLPIAIGSGMDLAIGAMLAGNTPEEAVKIAASRDPGTGGEITILRPQARPKLEAA